jgi:hypothetical protein
MKNCLCIILTFFIAAVAFGADFGLVLGTEGVYNDSLNPEGFSVNVTASPWVSAVWSGAIDLYVSGKMTFQYEETKEPPEAYFFEAERTELNARPAPGMYLGLGRRRFEDSAGLVATGLFDGAAFSAKFGMSYLSLGAYYTGLLYKETAKIFLTPGDIERYEKPLDSAGLEGYFASRRVLLALTGEFPDLMSRMNLAAQALAQFDVNGDSESLHSQYLELRVALEPVDILHLSLGGVGELAQGQEQTAWSMAAFGRADWEAPGALADMVSAELLWTSGRSGEKIRAFTPVSGKNAGRVFEGGTEALGRAAFSYRARPVKSVSLEAGAAYFIRTDLETLKDKDLDGASGSRLLGGEVYGSLVWGPDSAFRLSAGGGAFFPGWGGAFLKDAAGRWKADFGVIVAL